MTPRMSVGNDTEPVRRVDAEFFGRSLWIRWLSTSVPAAILADPLGNELYVPGFTASTRTAAVSVVAWRSSNAIADVAFSCWSTATDGGADGSHTTWPLEPVISAPATATVENARAQIAPMTMDGFAARMTVASPWLCIPAGLEP